MPTGSCWSLEVPGRREVSGTRSASCSIIGSEGRRGGQQGVKRRWQRPHNQEAMQWQTRETKAAAAAHPAAPYPPWCHPRTCWMASSSCWFHQPRGRMGEARRFCSPGPSTTSPKPASLQDRPGQARARAAVAGMVMQTPAQQCNAQLRCQSSCPECPRVGGCPGLQATIRQPAGGASHPPTDPPAFRPPT